MIKRTIQKLYKTELLCDRWDLQLFERIGGAEGDRTLDLLTASQALSQLSYSPVAYFIAVRHAIVKQFRRIYYSSDVESM